MKNLFVGVIDTGLGIILEKVFLKLSNSFSSLSEAEHDKKTKVNKNDRRYTNILFFILFRIFDEDQAAILFSFLFRLK